MLMRHAVRTTILSFGLMAAGLAAFAQSTPNAGAPAASAPTEGREHFDTIIKRLDMGGDLLVVADLHGVVAKFMKELETFASTMAADMPASQAETFATTVRKVGQFLESQGFYAVNGVGMSAVPGKNGMNTIKSFVARDPAAANLPLWKGLVGSKPRRLDSLDFIPQSAVMASVSMMNLGEMWGIVRAGMKDVAPATTATEFDAWLKDTATEQHLDLDQIFKAFGDETFVAFLSRSQTPNAAAQTPAAMMSAMIPFSLLMGAAVKSPTLEKSLATYFEHKGVMSSTSKVGDVEITTFAAPGPLMMFIQPAYCSYKGYFLMGSNPDVLKDALSAAGKKNGLASTAEFKSAFSGLNTQSANAISYVSPEFMGIVQAMQNQAAGATLGPEQKAQGAINRLIGMDSYSAAGVMVNIKSGVQWMCNSSMSGRQIAAQTVLAPVGMMAAIAIPSFVRARSMSQSASCQNNLRMLDAAKEQWALQEGKEEGAEPEAAGVLQFIKGSVMPVCPQGGTYKMNAIGEDPECSFPGHSLMGD